MGDVWQAEVEIDREWVRARLAAEVPELAGVELERLGEGWDTAAWLVGGEWVFRFPRRQMGAEALEVEIAFAPAIAAGTSLAMPVPEKIGACGDGRDWRFVGHSLVAGRSACAPEVTRAGRAAVAPALGRALAELHALRLAPELEERAPEDHLRRGQLERRLGRMEGVVEALAPELEADGSEDALELRASIERGLAAARGLVASAPWASASVWVHGDLYARHLLLDDTGALAGWIDWGDCHKGDPALDLAILFGFVPPEARPAFVAEYGPIDDATLARARFHALHYGVHLSNYGWRVGDVGMRHAGRLGLEATS